MEENPYPTLVVARPGSSSAESASSRYLLVGAGKHGANSQVVGYDRKTVRLRGTLIYRDNQTMVELVNGSISVLSGVSQAQQMTKELGTFVLTGEIVDSKCYFGVMNPGNGKVHRDCAVRCLSGGAPPVLVTSDLTGSPAVLLLTDPVLNPLRKEAFLNRVAQPVRIRGNVVKKGETWFLETEPTAVSPRQ